MNKPMGKQSDLTRGMTRRHFVRQSSRGAGALALASLLKTGIHSNSPVMTQDPANDEMITKYLAARAAELEREFLPGIKTAGDFQRALPQLREAYLFMLGLWPIPEKTPLNLKITGRLEQPGYTVEKLHFQSRPGLYVTANLYLPNPLRSPHPAILYLAGHYRKQLRDGAKSECQDHGIWFATHGYVALVPDTLELGEIAGVHQGTCPGPLDVKRWWWQSAGYTPAGVECWNAIRALDYLVMRPEVDPNRIGATGISGGGMATFWVAAADERVKAAAPVSGIGDLGYYVGESGLDYHCDCMLFYNNARWSWATIAALVCPRPLLFVNSDADKLFPMSSNERVVNRLEKLYAKFGASDQIDAMVSAGGHDYRTDIRRAVFEFFNRHFKGDARRVVDPDTGLTKDGKHRIEYRLLRVFPEDSDLPRDQLNKSIDETFVPAAKLELPAADRFSEWRQKILDQLRKISFAAWPAAAPAVETARLGNTPSKGREATEEGLEVSWHWLPGKTAAAQRWLIVLNPDEEPGKLPAWAHSIVGTGPALLLRPRDSDSKGVMREDNTFERAMALLGGTVDGGRIWDVMTVIRRRRGGGTAWHVAGRGQAGIIAAYAALYEPSIEKIVTVDPPPSHHPGPGGGAYGPVLLSVLRVCDIPEVLGCLAPRPLVLIGARNPAFHRTAALYQIAGAANHLIQKPV
jgi:dienelactone hydrolase